MQRDFSQVMANHPDAVLLEIVTKDRGDYEPAALAAADAELASPA
jgi:hypothetical protein